MKLPAVKFLRELFAHYTSYHRHGPLLLTYAGILGAVGFPLFYVLRFSKSSLPFDDLAMRVISALLCLLLLLKNHWPQRLRPYYFVYSYAALIVALPVTFVFTSLMNGGGVVAVGNTLMVAFFVILMTDWRNTLVMLLLGFSGAIGLYIAVSPAPTVPMEYLARLPLLILVVTGGCFFKLAANRATAETVRLAYASIAGTIAHEMRNPLGQLKHNLENMQQALPLPTLTGQAQTTLDAAELDELYRCLAQGNLAVQRGLQVISMTLDQVSEKPLDTTAFSYLSAAEATYKAVQEYGYESDAERSKVSIHVVEDFSFWGDETAYLFLIFNLIKNALHYLPLRPGARLAITIERQQVKVRDSGPGIHPDLLARLFEPFRSVGKSGGTGLGLAYCQRMMRAFGGEIGCESVVAEYTQFTMRFPPVSEQERETHRLVVLARARAAFAGKRLLIVDDDTAQRLTTRHKLQPLGAAVDEASDGLRALDLLARQRYDLVLLDLNMPVLDGYAVAEQIRQGQMPDNRDVCIVAYTSEPAHLASVKTHKAGMDGFVSKPCAQLPLVQALHHALEHLVARQVPDDAGVLGGWRVLVADDSPLNRKAVAAYLTNAGATVGQAGHGQAVLDHLHSPGSWDAILMDINMPGMNGLETTQAIRRSGMAWSAIPIIALTAHSDQGTLEAAQAAGMNVCITKPVEASVLFEELRRLAGSRSKPPAAPSAMAGVAVGPLLNLERLESYSAIGMLEELLNDYLPEMARLVDKLDRSVAQQHFQESADALHSLLGMSGEAGALALSQLVRQFYVPMVEQGAWPLATGWVGQVKSLATQTEQALRAYGMAQAPARAD
jgi:two-component system CAI-1 autoinducer sensor kinase/phosphatase CqsS